MVMRFALVLPLSCAKAPVIATVSAPLVVIWPFVPVKLAPARLNVPGPACSILPSAFRIVAACRARSWPFEAMRPPLLSSMPPMAMVVAPVPVCHDLAVRRVGEVRQFGIELLGVELAACVDQRLCGSAVRGDAQRAWCHDRGLADVHVALRGNHRDVGSAGLTGRHVDARALQRGVARCDERAVRGERAIRPHTQIARRTELAIGLHASTEDACSAGLHAAPQQCSRGAPR